MAQSGSGSDKPARARTARPKKQIACEEADGAVGGIALVDSFGFSSKPLVWAEVDGLAIVEGDIVIGTVEEARARDVSLLVSDPDPDGAVRSVGIDGTQFRWPGGVIPFEIDPGLTNPSRVTNAIAHWHAKTPLRLTPRAGETHFVRFVQGSGCSSPVGRRQTGAQNITLGSGCTVGNTIHEIGHAIGLWHEQSREDRDAFVRINWANIEAGKEHNFNQHISDGIDLGAYDFGSLMHYGPTAFTKNGLPTIEALQPLPAGTVMGQRDGLSARDVAGVKLLYPGLAWPKRFNKEFVKEVPDDGVIKPEFKENVKEFVKENRKENVKEFVKETFKDIQKEPVLDPFPKRFGLEPQGTIIEQPGRLGPNVLTGPVGGQQPFVLGRGSDFVSRYQAMAAGQAGEPGAPMRSSEERAVELAEIVTALDGVRAALAALADELAGEAGV